LIACGINIETADYTISGKTIVDHEQGNPRDKNEIPCWSMNALMDIVPESIIEGTNRIEYPLHMTKSDGMWTVGYFSGNMKFSSIDPIDCLVNIIERFKIEGREVND
jgi:hypothetical protein